MKPAKLAVEAPPAAPRKPPRTALQLAWDALTSLKLTIVCLAALMVLVVACTLAQVHLGTYGAVQKYMRAWIVWWDIPGTVLSVPIFPGGALAGMVLAVNLIAAQLRRLELSWKKAGLWVVHLGLILPVAGEFITGMFQRDDQLRFHNGETTNYVTSARGYELAVIDTSNPAYDDVYSVPDSLLAHEGDVPLPDTPLVLRVKRYWENSTVAALQPGQAGVATAGVGAKVAVVPRPAETRDEIPNQPAVLVEPVAGDRSYGTWLVAAALGAPQSFTHEGHTYQLVVRERREYLPYAITLKKFSHDVYPGTDIPKNFSSLVHLSNPGNGESRDVLIRMNQPLRYAGKTFYQASFSADEMGRPDQVSILQVVANPGWLLPYLSCVLVALGLLVHFGLSLSRWVKRQTTDGAPRAAEVSR